MKICLALCIILFTAVVANAVTRYSVATGNWNATSTWSASSGGAPGATAPVAGDFVFIEGSRTVTTTAPTFCANVTISTGSTLSIGTSHITITGTTTVNGTIIHTSTTGTKTMGTVVISGGTWTSNAGETYGITGLTLSGSTLNGTATGIFNVGAGGLMVTGSTSNTSGAATINVSGATAINGSLTFTSATGTKTFTGGINIASGGIYTSGNSTTAFPGNFVNSGTFTAGSSAITISGTATAQNIAGFTTTGTVTMSKTSGTATFTGNVNGGNLTINGLGGTLNLGAGLNHTFSGTWTRTNGTLNGGSSTFNLGGSASGTVAAFTAGTGTVNYYRLGTQTVAAVTYNNLTISGNNTKTLAGAIIVNGTLAINGGTLYDAGFQITGNATGTMTMAAASGLTLGTAALGTLFPTNFTNSNISLSSTGTVNYNSNQAQTISAVPTYGNLTLTATAAVTKTAGGSLNVNGNLIIGAFNTLAGGANTITVTRNLTNNLTYTSTGAGKILLSGGSAIHAITGVTSNYGNLELDDVLGATFIGSGTTTITGNLTVTSGTLTANAFTTALNVNGTTTIDGTLSINSATGTKLFTGLVTINNGGFWINPANESVTFRGGITNNGSFTGGTGTNTFDTNSQALNGTPLVFSFGGAVAITGAITITNNTTVTVTGILSGSIAGATWTNDTNSTLNAGNAVLTGAGTLLNASANGNTVNYKGTITQTVKAISTYYHLTLSGSLAKTLSATTTSILGNLTVAGTASATGVVGLTIGGDVILNSGTLTSGTFTHNVAGNWTNNGATFNPSSGSIIFNGSSSQTIGGTSSNTFNNITISNAAGVSLGSAVNATGVTLSDGLVTTTTTNLLTVTGTTPVSITGSSSSYINGPLARTLPANLVNGNYTFPVGKSGYNPLELLNTNTNSGGTVVIRTEVFDANCGGTPGVGMSTLNTNRYWNASITSGGGNFTNAQVQLTETGLAAEDAIGQSATVTGIYDRISNNPPSGNTLTSDPITTLGFFATGEKPIVTIVATSDGTEGGSDGLFTLTTSKQFTVTRTINLTITGTATNGTDYNTINTTVSFPASTSSITIPVNVINDFVVEPTETVILTIESGTGYAIGTPSVATVNIADNDMVGITVSPTSGLTTTEAGGQATFTVVLTSIPTANVTIGLSSNNLAEGTVSPTSLTFSAGNWNLPQTVTITGVNDFVQDGNIAYSIVTAAATSGDANYNGVNAPDVSVTNTDNDTAGIAVSAISGPTTEAGGTATFTIVLNSQPTGSVTIGLSSDDITEGTITTSSVIFTTVNWNVAQTITVTGVDDFIVDGNVTFNIVTAQASSSDALYNVINPPNVSVINNDNDAAGITVNPTSGLNTTEAGGQATFTIVLNSQPTNDVTISLTSDDTSEGTVSPSSVTFTTANWNILQTITITGVNDFIVDSDVTYHIITGAASSSDANYNNFNPTDVTVVNKDNDTAGITVNPTSGLTTTEAGGIASFTIVLNTQPGADVTISLSSGNTNEGTLSVGSVTFTNANWNTPQTITITGIDDFVDDGNIPYTILTGTAVSSDTNYNGIDPADVSVTNIDNDTAGITVNPLSGLITTEAGGSATFTIQLNSQPTSNVTIGLSSSNTNEGTVLPVSLIFTAVNWNSTQTVTVTGVNDFVQDGDVAYSIVTAQAASTDPLYSAINPSDVLVTNTDDDVAGIAIAPTSGLITTEAGGTATFTIVLNTQPTSNVSINLTSSNPNEGTVSPALVTFTSINWSTPQTITISGVNDFVMDGNISYTILTVTAPCADVNYSGRDAADVSVTNTDNDVAGITVTPTSGLVTTEAGGQASFTIKLNSQPTSNVTIGLSSNNTNEGTVLPVSLIFTSINWNSTQTVTVTGINDFVQDGNIIYSIVTAPATSADGNYNLMNAADVSVTNNDNDVAGITVSPTSGLITTESGGTATFTVVLTSQPTDNVTIGISSSILTEGTVSPASLIFTPANWNIALTVTVTGVDDFFIDGNIPYTILTAAATSTDGNYNGRNAADVSVTNNDNDVAGITIIPSSGLTTAEDGSTATFTIVLNTIPTAAVTIGLTSTNTAEGTVSPASVVISPANWNIPVTVTVTGVDDFVDDGDIAYSITTAAATSVDNHYNNLNPADVSVTNINNDIAGITVNPIDGLITSENLTTATFTIVLDSQPTANVTIGLSSDDNTEGSVSPSSVTFTTANWNSIRTVTVTGINDNLNDGDILYNIVTAAATSTDPKYSGMNADDVSVTNLDNDTPGITVTPTSGLVTTEAGGTATFTVVLITQPLADVTITLSSGNTNEGTVSPSILTFTTGNWNTAQTVTVTGVNDLLIDGNISYTIILDPATSADADYNGMDPDDVSVTNTDLTPTISGFSPSAVCYGSGSSIVISGTQFVTVTSVKINGISALYTVNSTIQITATLPVTATTGTVSVITATGTAVSASSLVVTPIPSATISYSGNPFCINAGVQPVTRTGTIGGTYTASPAGLTINGTTGEITPTTSTAGTYTVTYTMAATGGCSEQTATTSVTITTLPAATIYYLGSPFCRNRKSTEHVTISGSGAYTGGTYSSTAGLALDAVTGDIDLKHSSIGNYTITYTIAAAGPCSVQTATTDVSITSTFDATFSYADSPYCNNASNPSPTFAIGAGAGTFTSTSGLVFVNSATGEIDIAASTIGTYTVTNSIPKNGPCSAAIATTLVTIDPISVGGSIAGSSTVCSGTNSTVLSLSGQTGSIVKWQYSIDNWTTPVDITNATTSQTATDITAITKYRAVIQSGVCASVNSAEAIVTVNVSPFTSLAVSDAAICKPAVGNVTITVSNAENGVSYELKTLGGASLSPAITGIGTGANLDLIILQADAPTVTTAYKVVASIAGCSAVDLIDQPTVTVDDVLPVFTTCPSNISLNVDAGLCTKVVSWAIPTATDNCGTPVLTQIASRGETITTPDALTHRATVFVGTTTITYTATDSNNNIKTCWFTITITDNILPTIACPATITVSGFAGIPAAKTRTDFGTDISDNCSINDNSLVVSDSYSSSCTTGLPLIITRTYTISDSYGNSASCNQTINVNDVLILIDSPDLTACSTKPATLSIVTLTGFSPINYQWETSTNGGTIWTSLSGETSATLVVPSPVTGHKYRLKVFTGTPNQVCYSNVLTLVNDTSNPSFPISPAKYSGGIVLCAQAGAVAIPDLISNIDAVDNCTVLADLRTTYTITGPTPASGTDVNVSVLNTFLFPFGTSEVTMDIVDQSGNRSGASIQFEVKTGAVIILDDIATDGVPATDGSGYRPFQGTAHNYNVTTEIGYAFTWRVDKETAPGSGIFTNNITAGLAISGQGTATAGITWGVASLPANYRITVTKKNDLTNCEVTKALDVTVLNSFNPYVHDYGDACHNVTGQTTIDWKVELFNNSMIAPGYSWNFSWRIKLEGNPIETGTETLITADSKTISYTVVVGDGSEKNYRFEIYDVVDSLANPETSATDDADVVKIFVKPTIGF